MIKIKRIYDKPDDCDGFKILVDRLWPRGLRKDEVKVDLWLRDIAPSDALRKWFAHESKKWVEFKNRYFEELDSKKDLIDLIIQKSQTGVTLLYGAKNEKYNNANALKEYLENKML